MLELITENLPIKTGQLAYITACVKDSYYKPPDVLHYHTWAHIENMITILSQLVEEDKLIKFSPKAYLSLYLAVLFHDAQYIPGDTKNELRAMDLMDKFPESECLEECGGLKDTPLIKDVSKYATFLISSTTSHLDAITQIRYFDNQAVALLHDLDYIGFSNSSWDGIMEMENNIQRESVDALVHKNMSGNQALEIFRLKRLSWLIVLRNTIAEHNTMYMCDVFKPKDLQAFINIEKLISLYTREVGLADLNRVLLCN